MLMKKAINILGVPVTPFSMEEAVSFLMDRIAKKMPTQVVTANAEIIMMARNDKRYGTLLQQADLVLADGAGTVWAGRTLGYEVPERVAGFDLFVELIKKSAEEGIKLYFFGAAPGIAEAAKAKAEMLAPGVSIVGTRNGYFSETDIEEIIDEINASGAQILFAALGAPKQEYWLRDHAKNSCGPLSGLDWEDPLMYLPVRRRGPLTGCRKLPWNGSIVFIRNRAESVV